MSAQLQVKERPILFSGPMVRAILEGRKTQTRRVIKGQEYRDSWLYFPHKGKIAAYRDTTFKHVKEMVLSFCPYGQPGDRLWVRENFRLVSWRDAEPAGQIEPPQYTYYPANLSDTPPDEIYGRLRIARFMPRWASRITLEITDVRVERLQDVSEENAIAEGAPVEDFYGELLIPEPMPQKPSQWFRDLWDSINAKKHPWATNPWVWVIEFKKL